MSTYIPIKSSSPESFAEGINIVASYLTYNFVCNSSCSQALENVPEMDNLGASLAGGESAAPLFRGARRARRRSRRAPNAHPTTGISASAPARLIERPPSTVTALSFTPVSHAHGRSVHRYNWYHPVERTCPSMIHPLIPPPSRTPPRPP